MVRGPFERIIRARAPERWLLLLLGPEHWTVRGPIEIERIIIIIIIIIIIFQSSKWIGFLRALHGKCPKLCRN